MTDSALTEMTWPRWEFIAAMPDDDGVTVALALANSCSPADLTLEMLDDEFERLFAPRSDTAGRTLDSTGAENTFDG